MTLLRNSDQNSVDLINNHLYPLWAYTYSTNKWYQSFAGYDAGLWDVAVAPNGLCSRMESPEQMETLQQEMALMNSIQDDLWEYKEPKPLGSGKGECVHNWIIEGAHIERWKAVDHGDGDYSLERARNGSQSPGECTWCLGTKLHANTYRELETEIDDSGAYKIVEKQ